MFQFLVTFTSDDIAAGNQDIATEEIKNEKIPSSLPDHYAVTIPSV